MVIRDCQHSEKIKQKPSDLKKVLKTSTITTEQAVLLKARNFTQYMNIHFLFLISNFRRDLNVVCFVLCTSPTS